MTRIEGIGTTLPNALRPRRGQPPPSWYDAEIAWYVNERDGDMGVRGVPMEPGVGSDPEIHDGISDHQVRAATRSRRIETALHVLSPETRLLVQAVHFRISPNAHKDKHKAQEACIAAHEGEILVAVGIFRGAMQRC